MSDPAFTNSDFTKQITGTNAQLEIYNVKESMLYFTLAKNEDKDLVLRMITSSPEKVEFGSEDKSRIHLGGYSYKGTERLFFRFPKEDLLIDTTKVIKIDFGKLTYTVSVRELADFSANRTIYGGDIGIGKVGSMKLANHGALVGIRNEPSLQRLAVQIIGEEKNKEKISQKLLTFVNENIKFNEIEAEGKFEVLKRPNEVLMSGSSDCSGLTILYASLLEQTDIDYRLVYYVGHITAAVEGEFPLINGLNFESNGKRFHIAETTTRNFRIGQSKLLRDIGADKIIYVQKPGK
jgi:hypothetical protein